MKPLVYKVIFEGDVLPGFGQLDVQKKMANLFSMEVSVAARLFMGKQFEVKRGVTLEQAKKYARALAKLGAITFLVPYEENHQDSELSAASDHGDGEFTKSGSFNALAFTAYFENKLTAQVQEEETGSHELIDLDDVLQAEDCTPIIDAQEVGDVQQITRQMKDFADRSQGAREGGDSPGAEDPTLPGGYPVYTDVNKIKKMQEITLRMLAHKKLYE